MIRSLCPSWQDIFHCHQLISQGENLPPPSSSPLADRINSFPIRDSPSLIQKPKPEDLSNDPSPTQGQSEEQLHVSSASCSLCLLGPISSLSPGGRGGSLPSILLCTPALNPSSAHLLYIGSNQRSVKALLCSQLQPAGDSPG